MRVALGAVVAVVVGVVGVMVVSRGRGDGEIDWVGRSGDVANATVSSESEADALAMALVAERFGAAPSAESLRALFRAVGGQAGLTLGSTIGVHSTITFDPDDTNIALATLSNLSASQTNVWSISAGGISVDAYAPGVVFDDARFNRDGTIISFGENIHVGADRPLALATIRDRQGAELATMPEIFYEGLLTGAARSASDGTSVFIIPANIVYADGSENEAYGPLTALRPEGAVVLTKRVDLYEWIDVVAPGVLVAFPGRVDGTNVFLGEVTAVWDTQSLEPLTDHPLAGRELVRVVVTGDGSVAFGVDFDGVIQVIDMKSGQVTATFGRVDVGTVRYPLAVDHTGSVLVTNESTGLITMWFVADGEPVAVFETATARGLKTPLPFTWDQSGGVAFDTSRVVLRTQPRPEGITWTVIDTNIDSWIQRACSAMGRALTAEELATAEIDATTGICG